jgi:hypothetical protein
MSTSPDSSRSSSPCWSCRCSVDWPAPADAIEWFRAEIRSARLLIDSTEARTLLSASRREASMRPAMLLKADARAPPCITTSLRATDDVGPSASVEKASKNSLRRASIDLPEPPSVVSTTDSASAMAASRCSAGSSCSSRCSIIRSRVARTATTSTPRPALRGVSGGTEAKSITRRE